jgi:hypothetical protein
MSEQDSQLARYLKHRAARQIVLKVGKAKLIGVAVGAFCVVLFLLSLLAMFGGAAESKANGAMACRTVGAGKSSPPRWLIPIYQRAANYYKLGPRGASILTGINFVETSFGTNMNNTTGSGAEGWMMFLPETWATYGVDANGDGKKDPFNPEDAIFAAARYLKANGAPGDWYKAIFAYNHADWYVQRVEEAAAEYGGQVVCTPVAQQVVGGNAMLQRAETLYRPRAFKAIPASLWVGGGTPEVVDSRIWPDVVWVLQTFHLRVTAARETGHETHGDGTAIDSVPASGKGWDETARAAAEALGWRESCGYSGTAPVCPDVPAIQFIGYNGYKDHGDPAHAGENAHLHISWQSSSFGDCAELCLPPAWVRVFPLTG